ncbi:MAG: hypothetical protein Q8K07_07135 [Methylicorpusculum sp.]|uniref:hypothetical protein n=1 Tax=Methylicorpusculum sp. TaxID=2713644 RepID=UPI00272F9F38|nr:hypothetical protein [Methylicorpusculum sp.]MDP2201775.1 hypothetical protein [Methylicorpusculum sp.]
MNDWLSDDELDNFNLDADIENTVIRTALNMPPKPPIDWPQVLSLPLWNESETICYIFGIDSELYKNGLLDSSRQKFADDMRTRFEREAKAENLPNKIVGGEIFYKPNSAIAWAVQKGFPVIPELRDYISTAIENRTGITWDGEIQTIEPLTNEQKQEYNNQAAWAWVDAIYILQGYKPVFQLSTEQVRSHFPSLVNYFTQSIQLGVIGKEINQAGEKSFIDSPANWQEFWQGIHKAQESKAEQDKRPAVENISHSIRGGDIAPSNLLNAPSRQDDWFDLIVDMTKSYFAEFGSLPNEAQAWGRLWTNPPTGYAIETGMDKGEDCLKIPGKNPLSKSAFLKRWKKYTADKPQ